MTRPRLRYLGAREAGWTDDGFFVLRSRKKPVVVRIPMDRIGGRCEIVCERGLPAVPVPHRDPQPHGPRQRRAAAPCGRVRARRGRHARHGLVEGRQDRAADGRCGCRRAIHRRRVGLPDDRRPDARHPGADPAVGLASRNSCRRSVRTSALADRVKLRGIPALRRRRPRHAAAGSGACRPAALAPSRDADPRGPAPRRPAAGDACSATSAT